MSRPSIRETVICRECGKRLRGAPGVMRASIHIRRHKRPDGKPCFGHLYTDHRPPERS